jgi:hypothetical protein
MAIAVAPLTTVVMRSAGERHGGVASGVNNAVARVAGLLAVALLGAIAVGEFSASLDRRLLDAQVAPEIRQELRGEVGKLAEARVPREVRGSDREKIERLMHASFLQSFRVVMLISSCLALVGGAVAGLTLSGRLRSPQSPGG